MHAALLISAIATQPPALLVPTIIYGEFNTRSYVNLSYTCAPHVEVRLVL